MDVMPVFVSAFTCGTPYEFAARRLRDSLQALGLPYDIEPVRSRGSWLKNVHMIPEVCLRMLRKHHPRPIVWLDADATVERWPQLLVDLSRGNADFAVHHAPGWGADTAHIRELLDGTMYFAPTVFAERLLIEWIKADAARPGDLEQRVLQDILPRMVASGSVKVSELPAEYCLIHDHPGQQKALRGPGVVMHWQASRKYRYHAAHDLAGAVDTEDLLKRIRAVAGEQPIAVVGNGPLQGRGTEIDKHKIVVRFNAYRTEGREADIGSKTSAWCVNCWPDWKYEGWRGVPVFTPWQAWETSTAVNGQEVPLQHSPAEWAFLNALGVGAPKGTGELLVSRLPAGAGWRRTAQRTGEVFIRRPSVGFVLLVALRECGILFDPYGFSGNVTGHDGPAELAAIQRMIGVAA